MQNQLTKQEKSIIFRAENSLQITALSILKLSKSLPPNYTEIVKLLFDCSGRIIVTGIGKSALIAQKICATFNSTGTSSAFMHAADALHGDLGMLMKNDIILALSKSGNTPEIIELINFAKDNQIPSITFTSNERASLTKIADHTIFLPMEREADPNNLAPTTSSCLQLAMGDALALCLAELRGFKANDFGKFHPAGTLGKLLHLDIEKIYTKNGKPQVPIDATIAEVILEISQKRMGATAVLAKNRLVGIITDGDLRRMMGNLNAINSLKAKNIMSANPVKIHPETTAYSALQIMEKNNISQLLIAENEHYIGMIHLHDLL